MFDVSHSYRTISIGKISLRHIHDNSICHELKLNKSNITFTKIVIAAFTARYKRIFRLHWPMYRISKRLSKIVTFSEINLNTIIWYVKKWYNYS